MIDGFLFWRSGDNYSALNQKTVQQINRFHQPSYTIRWLLIRVVDKNRQLSWMTDDDDDDECWYLQTNKDDLSLSLNSELGFLS